MASSKKGKKNKGKTLALIDFLQDTPGTIPTKPIRKSTLSWADEVDDANDLYESRPSKSVNVVLPTAPKASRDYDDIVDKIPQKPPYMAYLSNLPYDIDENEITTFFKNLKISNMKIPKDDRPGELPKLKGYGYVEFEDKDSLYNALIISDPTIKNRRIRIEVATDYDHDKRRLGRTDNISRDRSMRSVDSSSSYGDWRSGPRPENSEQDRRGFSRDKDRERDRDDISGAWRDSDRRNNRDSDRGFKNDKYNRDDIDFSRQNDKDRDNYISRKYEERNFSKRDENEINPKSSEPRQRPKLTLAPRTKPIENVPEKAAPLASIFGNAKPVDTSVRERQIEERLAKENEKTVRESSRERRHVIKEKEPEIKEKDSNKIVEDSGDEGKVVVKDGGDKRNEKDNSNRNSSNLNGVLDQNKKNSENEKRDKHVDVGDKFKIDKIRKDEKREKMDREMPKQKKLDPPNFIANNKFASLENEDNSD